MSLDGERNKLCNKFYKIEKKEEKGACAGFTPALFHSSAHWAVTWTSPGGEKEADESWSSGGGWEEEDGWDRMS